MEKREKARVMTRVVPVTTRERIFRLDKVTPRVLKGPLPPLLTLVGVAVLWEVMVRVRDMPGYLLPAPSDIAGYMLVNMGLLFWHAQATVLTAIVGFVLAAVFGVTLSTLIVWSRVFERAVYPLVVMNQVIPKVAIAPLLIVYLGFGLQPKIFLSFLLSFFPIVINTTLGFKSVNPELLELLATLRANRVQVLYKIRAKQALPFFIEGAKIGVTLAVIGTVVSELVAGNRGLGYLVASSASSVQTVIAYSSLICLMFIGISLFYIIHFSGRIVTPWVRQR